MTKLKDILKRDAELRAFVIDENDKTWIALLERVKKSQDDILRRIKTPIDMTQKITL